MIDNLPKRLLAVRHGMSFMECLGHCISEPELIENYDKLRGANLGRKGSPIDLAVDLATGRIEAEIEGFIEFCWEYIFLRFGESS